MKKTPHVDAARRWLAERKERLLSLPLTREESALVKAIAGRYAPSDYDEWRRGCARHIQRLDRGLDDPGP